MNDCYWGGEWQQFYYECDTGRIIGELKVYASQIYEAYYVNAFGESRLGKYIDSDRARKAVEHAHKCEMEKWERMREVWNKPEEVVEKVEQWISETKEDLHKPWWKIWE